MRLGTREWWRHHCSRGRPWKSSQNLDEGRPQARGRLGAGSFLQKRPWDMQGTWDGKEFLGSGEVKQEDNCNRCRLRWRWYQTGGQIMKGLGGHGQGVAWFRGHWSPFCPALYCTDCPGALPWALFSIVRLLPVSLYNMPLPISVRGEPLCPCLGWPEGVAADLCAIQNWLHNLRGPVQNEYHNPLFKHYE